MADFYYDGGHTNNGDGDGWADQVGAGGAFNSIVSAGAAAGAGDFVWCRNASGGESGGSITANFTSTDINDPVIVLGVKAATSNTPPVNSDLIPGWRTGEARTVANRAYKDGDVPTITVTGASTDLAFDGNFSMYGIKWVVADNITSNVNHIMQFEECYLSCGNGELGTYTWGGTNSDESLHFKNCELNRANASGGLGANRSALCVYDGCIITLPSAGTICTGTIGRSIFRGCDLSDFAHALSTFPSGGGEVEFWNCKLHASYTVVTGGRRSLFSQILNHLSASDTGKSSGSIQNIDIATGNGDIVDETTAVRTGGADDGEAGGHSMAMTAVVGDTQDQYHALVGPRMGFQVTNTDTAVTVFIANSGAGDYNDDDAWLEIMDVSEGGTAQHTHLTTQMDLLATPSVIADDTDSTWGTGGNNPQKFVVTISPDFSGWAYCRVHFAKNFGSSPETLYVDPNPVTS